ncbi:MAG: glycosyltransferase family 4 protein [Nitrososphaerota archaeon]|nr:glycosyltransferase family 4 protein [Aigarchaeota archaeon]MDW8076222.1 glycosyltransferase family 4 protein [Nitrososphaerota archaeon]
MRVCIISHEGELGPQMIQFARHMVKQGVEVHAIIRSHPLQMREFSKKDGVKRHIAPVIPIKKLMFLSYFLSAFLIALPIRGAITVCREPFTGLIGAVIKLITRRKSVIYVVDSSTELKLERGAWRSRWLVKFGRLIERLAISTSDLVIALDHSLIPYLKLMGARRITVVSYGANRELFKKGDPKKVLKKLGLDGKRIVVYAGSMESYHGAQYLAKAAPIIKRNVPDSVVLFLGNGPLRRFIEKEAGDAGIFLGTVPYEELPDYFAAAEVAVAPPAPNSPYVSVLTTKIFDYIAAGKAIVATDVGGIKRAFGDAAIIVKPRDHVQLAEAIIQLLKDEQLRLRLERNAIRLAEKVFNWEKLTKKFVAALKEMHST